ncbi:MAG TPA: hypothetical protein VH816_10885 [Gaiellaceae bacterium]|jgi:glucose/arabinose dehydrogenase
MSFDRRTGDLYIGDVGETHREVVGRLPKRFRGTANFGWPGWEGSVSTAPAPAGLPGRVLSPLLEYAHEGKRCYAVVGGYVYRGADLPSLAGRYLYGDLCGGVWSARIAGGVARARRAERLSPPGSCSSPSARAPRASCTSSPSRVGSTRSRRAEDATSDGR